MRLVALVDSPDHVCCRYRLAAFGPHLQRAGHSLELRPWPRRWWQWLRIGRELRGADAVVLQRRLLPHWQLFLLRRAAPRLLFDFDDAVFLRDSYSRKGFYSGRRLRRFAATVRAADVTVAGNHCLAEVAAHFAGAEKVWIVPTCVDPARYPVRCHTDPRPAVQLVWIGSSSTLPGLEAVRPELEQLGGGVDLKLICDRFLKLNNIAVTECRWSAVREAEEIAAADIGISWVPDDLWSRGKCGLKVLQYMAAGLPVVANAVGVHAEMVRHGESGFLAGTPREWGEAILRLARDAVLRRRMGAAGRRRLEADYSVTAGGQAWARLLRAPGRHRAAA